MKKISDWTQIRQKVGVAGVATTPPPIEQMLTYFSNHEDDIQSLQILVWSKIVLR